jgi:hypothetical protein
MPLPLKPVPEVVICEMLRLAFPLLLIVMDLVPLLPTSTLPKLKPVALTLSCGAGAATPVPVRDTVGLLEALLTNEICPEALPAEVGANCAV